MDAGYDAAIVSYYGEGLKHAVQRKILDDWFGEQPVGTSISVGYAGITLVHTPVMRVPSIDLLLVIARPNAGLVASFASGLPKSAREESENRRPELPSLA